MTKTSDADRSQRTETAHLDLNLEEAVVLVEDADRREDEGVSPKADDEVEVQALEEEDAAGLTPGDPPEDPVATPQEAVASPLTAEPQYLGPRNHQEAPKAVAEVVVDQSAISVNKKDTSRKTVPKTNDSRRIPKSIVSPKVPNAADYWLTNRKRLVFASNPRKALRNTIMV